MHKIVTPNHHVERAEGIIRLYGLTFALAVAIGKEGEIKKARALLKDAIVRALDEAAKVRPNG